MDAVLAHADMRAWVEHAILLFLFVGHEVSLASLEIVRICWRRGGRKEEEEQERWEDEEGHRWKCAGSTCKQMTHSRCVWILSWVLEWESGTDGGREPASCIGSGEVGIDCGWKFWSVGDAGMIGGDCELRPSGGRRRTSGCSHSTVLVLHLRV